ncbi:unnamed protein product [Phytomonas sp. Hart1]|nr:unnamed protein product [Phytomonas sp. Hart1]|eukprot:CCW71496.1 unnamed protein product [Phytomonas sp. isolate Hart1]
MDVLPDFRSIPITTMMLLTSGLLIILTTFNILHPIQLVYSPTLVYDQKQYWRFITSFLYFGELKLNTLLHLNWVIYMSGVIEQHFFIKRSLDYTWLLFLGCNMVLFIRWIRVIDSPYLCIVLGNMLLYLVSRMLPRHNVNIVEIIEIPMRMLPIVYVFIGTAMYGISGIKINLVGYFVGHVLWYFAEIFPHITGIHLLRIQYRIERLLT